MQDNTQLCERMAARVCYDSLLTCDEVVFSDASDVSDVGLADVVADLAVLLQVNDVVEQLVAQVEKVSWCS